MPKKFPKKKLKDYLTDVGAGIKWGARRAIHPFEPPEIQLDEGDVRRRHITGTEFITSYIIQYGVYACLAYWAWRAVR